MFLGPNSGFNARDINDLQTLLTNAALSVRMDEERDSDIVLREYMERNINHPNPVVANFATTLAQAHDIVDRFNVVACMVQLAE